MTYFHELDAQENTVSGIGGVLRNDALRNMIRVDCMTRIRPVSLADLCSDIG